MTTNNSVIRKFAPQFLTASKFFSSHKSSSMASISSQSPIFIKGESLCSILKHKTLIDHFQTSLHTVSRVLQSPIRQNYSVSSSSSLLLMPCWSSSSSFPYMGVKLVTVFPQNSAINLPGVHASFELFSSVTGQPLAAMDGSLLTLYRTSCVSGLASKYLSRNDSQVLVMAGAGAMAPHLIKAHLSSRPSLRKVIIWNRTEEKARTLAEKMKRSDGLEGITFDSHGCMDEIVGLGDIVSCATNSETPLVKGEKLKEGAHLDLVGSFKHSMKECDDEAIKKGKVFVDDEAALVESGELVGAFERGVIQKDDIAGNLVELTAAEKVGRTNSKEITVFKSVGSATVDVLAAQLVYESYTSRCRQTI